MAFVGSLAGAVALAGALLPQASGPPGVGGAAPDWAVPVQGLGALALLAGSVVYLVGQCMACVAPAEAGARGWAIGALVSGLVSRLLAVLFVVLLVFAIVSDAGGAPADPDGIFGRVERVARPAPVPWLVLLVALASGLASLTEVVHVALFLRALAKILGEKMLVRRTGEYARFFATFTVGIGLLNFFAGPLMALIPGDLDTKLRLIPVAVIGEMVCFLILFGQFLGLVRDTRDSIAHACGGTSGPGESSSPPEVDTPAKQRV
jgi:hypothetical protein